MGTQRIVSNAVPKISAVVLNYNGADVIRRCLESLVASEIPLFEIVVADNASRDESPAIIRNEFPDVVLIDNGKNLGAPLGRNKAIERALAQSPDYVYMLDNDLFIDPPAIRRLLELYQSDRAIGCAGSMIYYSERPDLIFNAGNWIDWTQNLVTSRGMNQIDRGQFSETCDVDYVGSGAMFVSRKVLEEVGLFDPGYIGYGYEDSDFGMRVRAAGYRVVSCSLSKVWHKPFSAIGHYSFRKKYLEARNAIRFLRIHGNFWAHCKFAFYAIGGLIFASFREGARGNFPGVVGKARGLWDGLFGREDLAWRLLEDPDAR